MLEVLKFEAGIHLLDDRMSTHELFTPLHAIDGAVELLLDGAGKQLSHDARDIVALIAGASRELNAKIGLLIGIAEWGERPGSFLAQHTLSDLSAIVRTNGSSAQQPPVSVEVNLPGLRSMMETLQNHCGLVASTGAAGWQLSDDDWLLSIGQIDHRLATGEGSLAWTLAKVIARHSGVELRLNADLITLLVNSATR